MTTVKLYTAQSLEQYLRYRIDPRPITIIILSTKDKYGQNILFGNQKDDLKMYLIKLHPEALKCIDNQGRNILFYPTIKDCYKNLLAEKYPGALKQLDWYGKSHGFEYRYYVTNTEGTCYVCLCDYELNEELIKPNCGHELHVGCYDNMLKHNRIYKCYCVQQTQPPPPRPEPTVRSSFTHNRPFVTQELEDLLNMLASNPAVIWGSRQETTPTSGAGIQSDQSYIIHVYCHMNSIVLTSSELELVRTRIARGIDLLNGFLYQAQVQTELLERELAGNHLGMYTRILNLRETLNSELIRLSNHIATPNQFRRDIDVDMVVEFVIRNNIEHASLRIEAMINLIRVRQDMGWTGQQHTSSVLRISAVTARNRSFNVRQDQRPPVFERETDDYDERIVLITGGHGNRNF